MRMELIQPFINAADAVLSETLACPVKVSDISMDEETYQRHATASMVEITGDIEGRVIFDVEDSTAMKVASSLAGMEMELRPADSSARPSPSWPTSSSATPSPPSTTRDSASRSIPPSITPAVRASAALRTSKRWSWTSPLPPAASS